MPYKDLASIPNGLKALVPPISLEQANEIAAQADAIPESEGVSPWGTAINSFKKRYVVRDGKWVKRTEEAETEPATDDTVAEAATYKAAAMRLARDMETLLTDRSVPAALRKEVEDVRAMLRRTWADLEAEVNGSERPTKAEEPEDEEEPEMEETGSALSGPILERTYITLDNKRRVSLADCVRAYEQAQEPAPVAEAAPEEPSPLDRVTSPIPEQQAELLAKWSADTEELLAEVRRWLGGDSPDDGSGPIAEADAPGEGDATTSDPTATEEVAVTIEYAETNEQEVKLTEAAIDTTSGHCIELAEASLSAWDGQGPLKLRTVLIEAGPGNARDRHYYPAEMLRACAPIFEGRKMYASDHKADEKSVRTEVADILRCPAGYTDKGGIIAEVGIFDPDFARKVYNRAQLGTLGNLAVSIVGAGRTRRGRVDGQDYDVVQEITDGAADFVTAAGAGGRALAITEADAKPGESGKDMPGDAPQEEGRKVLTQEQVKEALAALTGPEPVKARLAEREYETVEAIAEALKTEVAYIEAATGAGKPVGIGEKAEAPTPPTRRTQEEHDAAVQQIITRLGIGR